MKELIFFLEEPSAKEMLQGFLPRIIPANVTPRYIIFEGKQDLRKQLEKRLRHWQQPDSCFVVMCDQDNEDCREVKKRLTSICCKAGKPHALARVVCHEFESWYLGDLNAVESGLGLSGLAAKQSKSKFRSPDQLPNPKQILRQLTKNRYQPRLGSRAIGPCLARSGNRSVSFNSFIAGVNRLLAQEVC